MGSQDFFFRFSILILIYFFQYKTIETHARAFLPLNISAVGTVKRYLILSYDFMINPIISNNLINACFQMPSQSLLWRAILQHLLLLHNPELGFQDQQVGRIAAKSANFVDYVQKSFVKLDLQLKVCNYR